MLTVGRDVGVERALVGVVLFAVVALAWAYLFALAAAMGEMSSSLAMPMTADWTVRDWAFMATMWAVMMIGMMLPSASPMIMSYRSFTRSGSLTGSTSAFATGYLVAWVGFAVLAAAAQWALHNLALVSPMGVATTPVAGTFLAGAGIFQFTKLKQACLGKCRTPLGFLMTQWRDGTRGAMVMGARHGVYCVTCCWALMVLLFVLGVMNLAWVAVLAAIVLVEKVAPRADALTRLLGAGLITWGAWLIVNGVV
jgi:predicted metal-binding membrane protein